MEPATNWFDESFATILKSHERFARQQRSRPSITYHVTSANSRIDHQLSGIKNIVLLHGYNKPRKDPYRLLHFHCETWIHPRHLTIFSNSLIRVSRRDEETNTLYDPSKMTELLCPLQGECQFLEEHRVIPRVLEEQKSQAIPQMLTDNSCS